MESEWRGMNRNGFFAHDESWEKLNGLINLIYNVISILGVQPRNLAGRCRELWWRMVVKFNYPHQHEIRLCVRRNLVSHLWANVGKTGRFSLFRTANNNQGELVYFFDEILRILLFVFSSLKFFNTRTLLFFFFHIEKVN